MSMFKSVLTSAAPVVVTPTPFFRKQTGEHKWWAAVAGGKLLLSKQGNAIWASSAERLGELVAAGKGVGLGDTLPQDFDGWAVGAKKPAAKAPAVAGEPRFALGAFMGQAASKPAARSSATPSSFKPEAEEKARTARQCRNTLALTTANLRKRLAGDIGGDLQKTHKSVRTSLTHYGDACKREKLNVSQVDVALVNAAKAYMQLAEEELRAEAEAPKVEQELDALFGGGGGAAQESGGGAQELCEVPADELEVAFQDSEESSEQHGPQDSEELEGLAAARAAA